MQILAIIVKSLDSHIIDKDKFILIKHIKKSFIINNLDSRIAKI